MQFVPELLSCRADPVASTPLGEDVALVAEMTADFARSSDIEATLRGGLAHIAARLGAEAASLFMLDPESGALVCRACCGPSDVLGLSLPAGLGGIVWRAVLHNSTELVRDTSTDPDFTGKIDQSTGFVTRSILCAPLSVRDERLGAIELFNKQDGGHFNDDDRRILQTLAASAALALVCANQAVAMAERQVMQRELALAADIQRAMLPPDRAPEYPIHGLNRAARWVSGDFFDVVELPGRRLAFAIADVSGKGMNAALLTAKTASLFRCLARRLNGPGALLVAIDRELADTASAGMFVTMVAGVLDLDSGQVTLANAGHERPLLILGNSALPIMGGLPPLGIDPELFAGGCPESVVDLAGGSLYLFTDGLSEAEGPAGMLGSAGVERLLIRHHCRPAPDRLAAVIADVAADGMVIRDDLTLLVIDDPRTQPCLRRQFAASPDSLAQIRHLLAGELGDIGCSQAEIDDIVLGVNEACQNVIVHAYGAQSGDMILELRHTPEAIELSLIDFAPPVDPSTIHPRALDDIQPGGLGTYFMNRVMDHVAFLAPPPGAGNILRMVKRRQAS